MSVKLTKKQMLCAGATGLWFLATKAVSSHAAAGRTPNETSPLDGSKDAALEDADVVRTLSPWTDFGIPLDPSMLQDLSPAPSTSSGPSTTPPWSFTLSSSTALEQLKSMMAYYNERVTYEDNLLSLSGDRCIFYHFLSLICLFLRIEVCIKNIEGQEVEPKKLLYTADCTRTFVFRSLPLVHYLLPEAINCEVLTTCLVENGQIVHHKDHYKKLGLSWDLEIPSLWSITKYTAGMAYTYLLNVIYFIYHLLYYAISMLGFEK